MEKGNFKQHPLMRLTLSLTLVLFTLFWLTNFAMFFVKMNPNIKNGQKNGQKLGVYSQKSHLSVKN
jgi:hypothetical protein